MTFSHWQELLDFQMNDSNFMKIIRMSMCESLSVDFEWASTEFLANSLAQKLRNT